MANFDPSGIVFAVAFTENFGGTNFAKVALYDAKNYESGSFKSWQYDCSEIKMLKFSNNNDFILCTTSDNYILVINSYEGTKISEIKDYTNENSIIEASFTPDSNFVISGSENGIIHIWNIENGESVCKLEKHFIKS